MEVDLVMDYILEGAYLCAGRTKIIIAGDSGLHLWAQKKISFKGLDFVLCPEQAIIAYGQIYEPTAKEEGNDITTTQDEGFKRYQEFPVAPSNVTYYDISGEKK